MKKVIITILLVLPFILIYFISFTGQILSSFTYIPVERIALLNNVGDELSENQVKCNIGDTYQLRIKVFPELATNDDVSISNSNKTVCSVNTESNTVSALGYGESTIIITSNDKHNIQYVLKFKVAQAEITDIAVSKTSLTVPVGKTDTITITIIPDSTILAYRDVIWSSANESIARVDQHGRITGVSAGTTTITVKSQHKPSIFKEITVTVTEELLDGVWFVGSEIDKLYSVPVGSFDLKTITEINNIDVDFADLEYKIISSYTNDQIDDSNLANGIITFKQTKVAIKVSVSVVFEDKLYSDEIRIKSKSS